MSAWPMSLPPFEDKTLMLRSCIQDTNVRDYKKGIAEMGRVVKRAGGSYEFTSIQTVSLSCLTVLYYKVLTFIGEMVSGRKGLINIFHPRCSSFRLPMNKIHGRNRPADVKYYKLTFGITAVHVGTK
jgi:ubiquinone/menaquinone biosynthesis C-methylase UbiE